MAGRRKNSFRWFGYIFATFFAVAMLLVAQGFPLAALAEEAGSTRAAGDGQTVLAFSSDVHNSDTGSSARRTSMWIEEMEDIYGPIDIMAFGGDMASATASQSNFWTYTQSVMSAVKSAGVQGVYTTGNHEHWPGNFSGTGTTQASYTYNAVGATGDNFILYCFGSTYSGNLGTQSANQEYVKEQTDALQSFLDNAGNDKVIIIITHFPLHYTRGRYGNRTTNNAGAVVDILNDAVVNNGQKIVYLWGHNHTEAPTETHYDEVFAPGDSLQLTSSTSSSKEIQFYYGAAGCMSDSDYGAGSGAVMGKGLILTIDSGNNLLFSYHSADGNNVTENGTNGNGTPFTEQPPVAVTGVSINAPSETIEVEVRRSTKLTATVEPNNATNKAVTWSSSDPSIARVDTEGRVTGVAVGTATITVTAGEQGTRALVSDSIEVTVNPRSSTEEYFVIMIDDYALSSHASDQVTTNSSGYEYHGLDAVTYSAGEAAPHHILWTLEEVDGVENGYYIKSYDGEYLSATYVRGSGSGYTGRLTVGTTEDVWIVDGGLENWQGNGAYLKSTNASDNPRPADIYLTTRESNNGVDFFTVGSSSNYKTSTLVEPDAIIEPVAVTGIELDPTSLEIEAGKSAPITATVLPTNADDKTVEWSSSDTSIATVDTNGRVRGISTGTATITATTNDGGHTATCEVTVTPSSAPGVGYVITIGDYAMSCEPSSDVLINSGSGSQQYTYTGLTGVPYDENTEATPETLWLIEPTEDGYYIKSQDGRYLNATYEPNSTGGNTGVLKVDDTPDVWTFEGSLEDWVLSGSTLHSANANKYITHEEGTTSTPLNLFTVRSTGESSSMIDPDNPAEVRFIETTSLSTGKDYIVAVTKDGNSVYAIENVSGTTSGDTGSRTFANENGEYFPAAGDEKAYIVTGNTGVVWNYNSDRYLTNNTRYLSRGGSSGAYVPRASGSGSAITYDYTNKRLSMSYSSGWGSGTTYYLTNSNGTFGLNTSTSSAAQVRIFEKTSVFNFKYVVQFTTAGVNYQSTKYAVGEIPVYTGVTPTRADSEQWTYTFSGWSSDGGQTIYGPNHTLPAVTGPVTYAAQFTAEPKPQNHTVTFESNDGSAVEPQTVEDGGYASAPDPAPTKEGCYAFGGWYSDEDLTTAFDFENTAITEDITLYAKWVDDHDWAAPTYEWAENHSSVTAALICNNDPEHVQTETVNASGAVTKPATCTEKGETTYTSAAFENTAFTVQTITVDDIDALGHDYEFTKWTWTGSDAEGYTAATATFTCSVCDEETDGHSVTENANVTVTDGEGSDIGKTIYTASVTVNGQTYTDVKKVTKKFTITFLDEDGETVLQTGKVAYGETPEYKGEDPTKAATDQYTYAFSGWTPEVVPVTGDATYTAQFTETVNEYTVTFVNEDGTELQSSEVAYGATPEYKGETPAKAATDQYTYAFAGWTPEVVAVTGDATYTATYTSAVNEYTVTFVDEDGETVLKEAAEYEYGTPASEIEVPDNPTKDATAQYTYTFAGWTPAIADVTADATYTATYTPTLRSYTVTFVNEDGTELSSKQYDYGTAAAEIEVPADPTKAADAQYTYEFAGWDSQIVVVTGDKTYTATYTSTTNKYTVTFVDEDGTTVLKEATEYEYGTPASDIVKPADPTKAGDAQHSYTFAGWTPELVAVTGDATYTATYTSTVNEYIVTWKVEGQDDVTETYAYGATPEYTGETPTKESTAQYSYEFAGWDPEVAEVTGAATYTAQFNKVTRTYTVTWKNEDGSVLETDENVPYGTVPTYTGETPTKAATAQYTYTFVGWDKELTPVTEDTTFTATYNSTLNNYTVTWENFDGSVLETDKSVPYGSMPSYNGETPTKAGDAQHSYTFKGWDPEVAKVTGEATYTAQFTETVNKYTVTFDPQNDEEAIRVVVDYGTAWDDVTKPSSLTKTGYTFGSWTGAPETVTSDVTVTATWIANTYTVVFNANDTEATGTMADQHFTYDEAKELTANAFAKENYSFAGWATSADGSVVYSDKANVSNLTAKDDATITLYAIWTQNPQVTITFKANGPEADDVTQTIYADVETALDANTFNYTGHTFDGWNTEADGSGKAYADGDKVTLAEDDNLTLYAQWKPITYTVTFMANNHGEAPASQTVGYNAQATQPDDPSAIGYTFDGWYTEAGCENAYEFSAIVAGDLTLFAKWTPTSYTITYDLAGGSLAEGVSNPDNYTIESGEITLNNPAKEGYDFAGWTGTGLESATEHVTIASGSTDNREYTATWTAKQFDITFVNEDGTPLQAGKVPYGETPEYTGETPTKAATAQYSYTFAGWEPEIVAVTGDATYTAKYTSTVNEYTVSFVDGDGNVLQSSKVPYGEMPAYTGETPTKTASAQYTYEFKGWDSEIVAVTDTTTYTAQFNETVNKYTIIFVDDDDSVIKEATEYAYGTAWDDVEKPDDPSRDDYTFAGWTNVPETITENVIVKASYTAIPHEAEWVRLPGNDRFETSAMISQRAFPEDGSSEYAVVAFGWNFPDALVASSVAGLYDCPVLLTDGKGLSPACRAELERLGVQRVYIMGSNASVSDGVREEIEGMGIWTQRIEGADRQGTSVAAMRRVVRENPGADTVVVTNGTNYPDALAMGPWCYATRSPMLLTGWDHRLTQAQLDAIADNPQISNVIILGDGNSVDLSVEGQLASIGIVGDHVERLGGVDRFDTGLMIAEWEMGNCGMGVSGVVATNGWNFPDALAASALCGRTNSVMVLVGTDGGSWASCADVVLSGGRERQVRVGYVLGQENSVSAATKEHLEALTE